jgi:hypothetical protein
MSVNQWKKMRRKQQEVVLKVWENVLETMKFRAAGKADFGSDLAGLYGPKSTPFDVALQALKELCGEPKFHNPCPGCVFLGNYNSGPPSMTGPASPDEPAKEKCTWYDLYYCNQGKGISKPTVSARFQSALNTGDLDISSYNLSEHSTVGKDLGYLSSEPWECEHPALKRARDEAVARGLIEFEDAYKNTKTITFEP